MAPPAEDRLLAALLERGEVEEEDVAWATASAEAGRADSTLDPRQARWGLRVGALLAGGRVDELVLEEVRRDLGTTRAELTAPAPAPADPYEIIRPLGAGGMGEVFLARDRRLDRLVALKVLSGEDRRRFLREARAQARSVHDGICQVYEIGERQGHAFIAMRFVDGPSLKAAASGHTLVEKVQIVRDLALALHESHEQGVIHRDVKPSNVLLERRSDGGVRPILTDFGLAREPRGEDLTESGAILGTPAYMSPEQARATERIVDRRTDVYSLGATLYEMLVGAPPFTGASTLETALAVVERDPVPPRQLVPGLPEDLEVIALKCLAKDPVDRYETALALSEDLGRHLAGEPIQGRRLGFLSRARRLLRRRPRTAVAGACAIGLLAAAGGAILSSDPAPVMPMVAGRDARFPMTELPLLAGHSFGEAHDINDSGLIVGYSAGPTRRPVSWQRENGVMVARDLGLTLETAPGTPGESGAPLLRVAAGAAARAVSSRGHIVGFTQSPARAFVYRSGNLINLGRLEGLDSQAYDINDDDDVVGFSGVTTKGVRQAGGRGVLFRRGRIETLEPLPGGDISFARSIDDSGEVIAGESNVHPGGDTFVGVVWRVGEQGWNVRELPVEAPSGGYGIAMDLNRSGVIAGFGNVSIASGSGRPYLWAAPYATFEPLSVTAPGCPPDGSAYASALSGGEVVGAVGLNAPSTEASSVQAAIWLLGDAGKRSPPICLGTLGGRFSNARAVNARGDIVGVARTAADVDRPFVIWRPEPGRRGL